MPAHLTTFLSRRVERILALNVEMPKIRPFMMNSPLGRQGHQKPRSPWLHGGTGPTEACRWQAEPEIKKKLSSGSKYIFNFQYSNLQTSVESIELGFLETINRVALSHQ